MLRRALVLVALSLPATVAVAAGGGPSPGVLQGGQGVLAPGGKVRYVAVGARDHTTVTVRSANDGRVLRALSVPGSFGVPLVAKDGTRGGISGDGRTLVLASFPTLPSASAVTRFAIVDTNRFRLLRIVKLRGAYSYDASSPNGRRVFVIEYLRYTPSANAVEYKVRALDARTGRLEAGTIAEKGEADENMQGFPVTRTPSHDGGWAYTLYARAGAGKAFVHALDTAHGSAFCIDLPWSNGGGALGGVRMVLTHAGSRLELRHPVVGLLATIDTRSFRVRVFKKPVAPGTPTR